jgi:hypothetical protein
MIRSLFLFSFLIFFQSFSMAQGLDQVLTIAKEKKISQERQWRKLLHFEPGFLGQMSSQMDDQDFFLSDNGHENLEAELEATLKGFWNSPKEPEDQIAQCRYPARFRFLKKKLGVFVKDWPDRACPRFEKYLKALQGNSLSLVFSSFYLNNPSSAFGHTFIRINKAPAPDGKRFELLDYGINYAAEADSYNAAVYAFKGLFGFFPGKFTSVPYYFKVREYNNAESRDLWEYELNVGPAEVEMFIAHMWELGPTYLDYWYLTENCSYHMLTALEAAAPDVDVVAHLKKWVIPSDTVKDVWSRPGLVKGFEYRPSVRTEFFYRLESLSEEEQIVLKRILDERIIPEDFLQREINSRQKILDTGIDYMDYKYGAEIEKKGKHHEFKNQMLTLRSQIQLVTPILKIPVPEKEKPHEGHGSRRLNIGGRGSQKADDALVFGNKFALHDQTDLITGYPEYASIDFGDFQFSYLREKKKLELENFTLFEVISFSPLSRFSRALSWRIKVGAERMEDLNCLHCHGALISGGFGGTFLLTEIPRISMFAGLRIIQYYTPYGTGNRFLTGVGPSVQIRARWRDNFISTIEGWYRYDLNSQFDRFQKYEFATQYSVNKSWAAKIYAQDLTYDRKAQLEVLYFY